MFESIIEKIRWKIANDLGIFIESKKIKLLLFSFLLVFILMILLIFNWIENVKNKAPNYYIPAESTDLKKIPIDSK